MNQITKQLISQAYSATNYPQLVEENPAAQFWKEQFFNLLKEYQALIKPTPPQPTNLTTYQAWLQARNRSPKTIQAYTQALKQFGSNPITTESIRTYLKAKLTKYQPNTLKIIKQALSSYAKFAKLTIDWDLIQGIIPKMQTKFFTTINPTELAQLKAIQAERKPTTHQRNNLILDFLFYSGLRVSELVNVKHSDWQGKSLRVHGKGNKVRYIFLPDFLVQHLKPNSSDYLFTNQKQKPLSDLLVRQIIQRRAKLAGIDKNLTPHSFRRSFATLLNNNGTALTTIQKLLGHSQITTTSDYIHNDYDTLYRDYSKMWKVPHPSPIINYYEN